MTDLVICLSTGKGTWQEVTKVINSEEWDKIFLITNDFGKENFKHDKAEHIVVSNSSTKALSEEIYSKLKGKLSFGDVAVNFVSGTGKEHMALLGALLKLGVGIRIIDTENEKLVSL